MSKDIAHVHRFRDKVAVSIGDGSTTYLSPILAREIAREMTKCADDCDSIDFVRSPFLPISFPDPGKGA